jgi:hypothetical protein
MDGIPGGPIRRDGADKSVKIAECKSFISGDITNESIKLIRLSGFAGVYFFRGSLCHGITDLFLRFSTCFQYTPKLGKRQPETGGAAGFVKTNKILVMDVKKAKKAGGGA